MKNKLRGFTLIELLVVIAIIGLLASVILVNTGGIRGKAKVAKALEFSQSVQTALGSEAGGIWSFDEGPEATPMVSAKDASGYNNNGTCSGASCPVYTADTPQKVVGNSPGKYALSFDGVDDLVRITDSSSLSATNEITVEAWVEPGSLNQGSSYRNAAAQYAAWPANASWILRTSDNGNGRFTPHISVASGAYAVGCDVLPIGQWSHIVLTYDNETLKGYINGALSCSQGAPSGNLVNATADITIGGATAWEFFNGLIDEVRIYGQVLTIGEIQKHYAEGLESHQNIVVK